MSPDLIVWAIGAAIAALTLLSMMRRRQTYLAKLIQSYVEKHIEWSRRRRKAALIVQEALEKKAAEDRAVQAILSRRATPSDEPDSAESVSEEPLPSPESPDNELPMTDPQIDSQQDPSTAARH